MGSHVDETGAKLSSLDPPQVTAPAPKPKKRARRMGKLLVIHRLEPNEKLYAAFAKKGWDSADEYRGRFFNRQEDAEAWIARQDEPYALFKCNMVPEPVVSDKAEG